MQHANIRRRIVGGDVTIGTWLTIGHSSVVEVLCDAGFDWITIDLEHNTIGLDSLRHAIIAGQSKGVAMFVRVPQNDEVFIKQALDAGADGLIVPMVKSGADALRAVQYAHYPPLGSRGVGLSRAQGYGESFDEYLKWCEKSLTIIVQIEHVEAVHNLEEIAQVEGIDAMMIGPYDLSASMNKPGQFDDPAVRKELDMFKRTCQALEVNMGLHIVPLDDWRLEEAVSDGYTFIAFGTDFQFLRESKSMVQNFREQLRADSF